MAMAVLNSGAATTTSSLQSSFKGNPRFLLPLKKRAVVALPAASTSRTLSIRCKTGTPAKVRFIPAEHRWMYEGNEKLDPVCMNINAELLSKSLREMELPRGWCSDALLAAFISFPALLSFTDSALAESSSQVNQIYGDLGAGLELGVQVLYLAALLGLVGVASFFVVKQVLIRRELESAARDLQDRVRTGEALPVEYFELGAVMLRKKFYVLASKYLEQAIDKWDGDPQDLAQVHNALGYSLVSDGKIDKGITEYQKAVKLQPGYVVAWNNLGSAYEKKKNLSKALEAYEQALLFDPNNRVAREYRDALKKRVDRLAGIPVKYD